MPKSANEILEAQAVTHLHFVERHKSEVVNKMFAIMQEAEMNQREFFLKTPDSVRFSKKRSQELYRSLGFIENEYAKKYDKLIGDSLFEFGGYEAEFSANSVQSVVNQSGLHFNTVVPTPEQVFSSAIAGDNPMIMNYGKDVVDLVPSVKGIELRRKEKIVNTIRAGFIEGKTNQQISRDTFGLMGQEYQARGGSLKQARNYSKMTVRTGMNHMSTTAKKEVASQNQELIKGYEIVATLDSRTTYICRDLDGLVWLYANPSASTLPNEEYSPFHRDCRTTHTFILKSWKEFGVNANEIPKTTRASMNGQVPKGTTYYKWLEKQPSALQKEVLGKTRYDLWKNGTTPINSFQDRSGNYLTLKELKEKDYKFTPMTQIQ